MAKIPIGALVLYSDDIFFPSYKIPASSQQLAKYRVIPLKLLTEDGDTIIIDKITDIRREASTKAGGLGERYTCLATSGKVQKQIYVYKDEDEWYMEDYFNQVSRF